MSDFHQILIRAFDQNDRVKYMAVKTLRECENEPGTGIDISSIFKRAAEEVRHNLRELDIGEFLEIMGCHRLEMEQL